MNETINTILSRRSIRNYSTEQVKQNDLDLIVKAGLYAPSGHNQQSWHFTVVQDKELIDSLSNATKEEMAKTDNEFLQEKASDANFHLFYHSPTIIVISGENAAIVPNIDCAAAAQNMLIAAESINIGTCWIGLLAYLFRSDRIAEFTKLLGIPEGYTPYYAITVGYKNIEKQEAFPRRENTVNYIR